jgi:hypothetical protein
MPEAVIIAIAEVIGADLILVAANLAAIQAGIQIAALVASTYQMHDTRRKQQNAARDAANASQRDRYVQFRSATAPRQVVLGRQRVSGPLGYIGSYGPKKENLVFVVIVAAHEIDGFEADYFSDEFVSVDGAGDVQGVNQKDLFTLTGTNLVFTLTAEPEAISVSAWVDYGTTRVQLTALVTGTSVLVGGGTAGKTGTVTIQYRPLNSPYINDKAEQKTATLTLDAAGNGSVTLTSAPDGGVFVITAPNPNASQGSLDGELIITPFASLSGLVVTVTGAPANAACTVAYTTTTRPSLVNIKRYTGAPGQTADADMMAALPGVWTSAHVMTGLAYVRITCKYNSSAFAQGYPQYSAVVRGAKLLDPRTNTTAWSENLALMTRYVATSPLLGRQAASVVNVPALITAANICDTAAAYVVDGQTHNRALYTGGMVVASGTRAKDTLDALCTGMAGEWIVMGGELHVFAGAAITPLQTLDESWVTSMQSIQVQAGAARGDVYNQVTGLFVDGQRDYKSLPYPTVDSTAYQALDGGSVLPVPVDLDAVNFVGQAQQVVAARMRDARQALRMSVVCNMRAYPVQPLADVLWVNLPEFGFVNQKMRVMAKTFTVDGGIALALKKYDSNAWNLGLSFSAEGIAPNSVFNSPVVCPRLGAVTCASGTAQLLRQADGTVLSRMLVSWPTVTDAYVLDGGGVEVKWGRAGEPEAKWQTDKAPNGQANLLVGGVLDTAYYLVKARTYNSLVQGPWSPTVLHRIIGKTARPPDVTGLSVTVSDSGVLVKADRNPEADRGVFEVHNETAWSDLTSPVYAGDADRVLLPRPAAGTYYFAVKHRDSSGNYSLNAALGSVVVNALPGGGATATWTTLSGIPANLASLAGSEAILNSLLQPSITALITAVSNLGSDNILSPGEKPAAVQAYNVIIADQPGIDAQATVYAITTEKTAYDNAVAALTSYLGTLSGWNTIPGSDVAIVGTTFSQKFADVYTTQRTLLLKIQTALKALSDAAQAAANAAATAASNAQSSANSALSQIADITSDNLLTVDEKPAILQATNVIALEQAGIDAQAVNYAVTTEKTAYDTAVSALATYLSTLTTPFIWSSFSGPTSIVGATFRQKFQDVYVARQAVLDAVQAKALSRLGALATRNTVGTPQIDPFAATEPYFWFSSGFTGVTSPGVNSSVFAITSAVAATIEFTGSFRGTNINGDAGNPGGFYANGSVAGVIDLKFTTLSPTTGEKTFNYSSSIPVAAGETVTFGFFIQRAGGNPVNYAEQILARAALIKR